MAEDGLTPSSDKTVLVIDDDDEFRKYLLQVLGKEGFRTDAAGDGDSGLKKIQTRAPDLIILDLMLPGYGGFEILRHLQTSDAARVPVIVVTARTADRSMIELIRQESNVVDFMQKPVRLESFVMALHKILQTQPVKSEN